MNAWDAGLFRLAISEPMIGEVRRTLEKPYFLRHADQRRVDAVLAALRSNATIVTISTRVEGVASHPEDDVILATAISARAGYLVTGDLQLQRLERYRDVRILSPISFVSVLEETARLLEP